MEEAVDRLRRGMTHARHGANLCWCAGAGGPLRAGIRCCGVWPPLGKCPIVDPADHFDRGGLQFEALAFGEATTLPVTSTEQCGQVQYFILIIRQSINDGL